MNTHQLRRCLARIEQQLNAGQIAPNQHDPRLVQLLQYFKGKDFQIEMVPLGLSVEEVWEKVTASDRGWIRPVLANFPRDDPPQFMRADGKTAANTVKTGVTGNG